MNYISLLNMFYERVQCSRVSNNAQLLYYTLLAINNKCSWSDWFSRTNVSISSMMGISEKSFMNARAELKQIGLIDFIPSKKRGECTKYRILNPTNYSTNYSTNDSTDAVQTTVQTTDINKLKDKQKSISYDIPEKSEQVSNKTVISFPLEDGTMYDVLENDVIKYQQLYPDLDVMQELRSMVAWCDANVTRRKKRSGVKRFMNGWLNRTQKSGGMQPLAPVVQVPKNRFHNFEQRETDYDALLKQMN